MIRALLQRERFDAGAELDRLAAIGGGAVASFVGVVRGGEGLTQLRLDHYPGMTERMLVETAEAAAARWPLLGVTLIHRFGPLAVGEPIVLAACASPHRAAALEACAYLIDQAKTRAPFWKQETFADGSSRWVEARAEDEARTAAWS